MSDEAQAALAQLFEASQRMRQWVDQAEWGALVIAYGAIQDRLNQARPPEPPLKLNERVKLGGGPYFARFDGTHVVIEAGGIRLMRITPLMMAHLFDFNRRVVGDFPMNFAIDLGEVPDEP